MLRTLDNLECKLFPQIWAIHEVQRTLIFLWMFWIISLEWFNAVMTSLYLVCTRKKSVLGPFLSSVGLLKCHHKHSSTTKWIKHIFKEWARLYFVRAGIDTHLRHGVLCRQVFLNKLLNVLHFLAFVFYKPQYLHDADFANLFCCMGLSCRASLPRRCHGQ